MEKIIIPAKMSKINPDSMFFEIVLSRKGDKYRARSSSLSKIINAKVDRPEAISKISFENAIQRLIPKIEKSLENTDKRLGKIIQDEYGKIKYSIENIVYDKPIFSNITSDNSLNFLLSLFTDTIKKFVVDNMDFQQVSSTIQNSLLSHQSKQSFDNNVEQTIISVQDVIVEWQQTLLARTKKNIEDDDYLSPTTLESYSRNLRLYVFPYLEKHPKYDNIKKFNESNVNEIISLTSCKDTQRVLLLTLKMIFEYSKQKLYISINPIANKKLKKKKQVKKPFDFIEESQRPLWINCMLEEINSINFEDTDAPLAFLFTLLHGNRPEETCGTKWIDLDFSKNDYHIQNAYKKIPIYDEETMKRIAWKNGDGPLKTPESDRHLSLDLLIKPLLIEHKKKQKEKYKKIGRKWSENEYVFLNSTRTPFTPDILSRNFNKFIKRNGLSHIVLYGLRHSFATHCRNLGMPPEVLALLMGHTEYETTQKYYIHISAQQKIDEMLKVQKQDIQNYQGKEHKNLTHLQSNINKFNKNISNLEEIQKKDMLDYSNLDNNTLNILNKLILQINKNEVFIT